MSLSRLFVSLALLLTLNLGATAGAEKLNVVLIVADDLGWADLGCYGSDLHETPHLNRLANRGVRFTDAYSASPVCSPSRAAIMTGLHPARLHMTIWREAAHERGNRKLLEPVCLDSLPLKYQTLAELLKGAGYYSVHVGKWHLGRAEAYPEAHGFQRNIGGTLWGAPQTFWYPFAGDQYYRDWRYVPGLEPGAPGDYLTDKLTDAALDIITEMHGEDRPFYLNLWYHTVHTPTEGKPELVRKYEAKITDKSIQRNPHYAAMVESLDENVGRVLAKLDELGIADETLVVFTSDNGGFVNRCKLHPDLQVANNTPLRSGKGSCYEGGVRIPLMVSGPGVATGVCNSPVASYDLLPTIASWLGLAGSIERELDGVDFSSQLRNPVSPLPRDTLYFHYPHYYPTTTPVSAIRKEDWKLLEYFEDGHTELYHLSDDLGETRNLASEEPEIAKRLLLELHQWRADVGAQLPERNPAK